MKGLRVPYHCWSEADYCKLLDLLGKSDIGRHWFCLANSSSHDGAQAMDIEQGLCLRLLDGTGWMECMIRHDRIIETPRGSLEIGKPWRENHMAITRRIKVLNELAKEITRTLGSHPLQAIQASPQARVIWKEWQMERKNTWLFKYVVLRKVYDPSRPEGHGPAPATSLTLGPVAPMGDSPVIKWTQAQTVRLLDEIASSEERTRNYFPANELSQFPDKEKIEKALCLKVLKNTYWMTKMIELGLRRRAVDIEKILGEVQSAAELQHGSSGKAAWVAERLGEDEWQKAGTNTWYFKLLALEATSQQLAKATSVTATSGIPQDHGRPHALPSEDIVMDSSPPDLSQALDMPFDPSLFRTQDALVTLGQDHELSADTADANKARDLLDLFTTLLFDELNIG
ncbi:hypothetical protein I316_02591 [Kwoniella heveanensis BCC8398]|uniref:Uncharacterized protein n=1 Tax=Kwoniella heveanensis BCC8398 TaxID=1296120 RepID=A0A1B9GWY6_9TREE|nr:hypothetical protein I316_02591 [Kwoniella heveanensis BCC8398]